MEDEGEGGENSFCLFMLANKRHKFGNSQLKWENFGKNKVNPFLNINSVSQSSPGQDQYGDHFINKCRPVCFCHFALDVAVMVCSAMGCYAGACYIRLSICPISAIFLFGRPNRLIVFRKFICVIRVFRGFRVLRIIRVSYGF
jgi:hypothetical protein